MYQQSFLRLLDFETKEIQDLLDLSAKLKKENVEKREVKRCEGKNIVEM